MKYTKVAAVVAGALMTLGFAAPAMADSGPGAYAEAIAVGSPGFLSGNVVQIPIHHQVNICGNSVSLIGLLSPSFGNVCINR